MRLVDWHLCRRWWRKGLKCAYRGLAEDEEAEGEAATEGNYIPPAVLSKLRADAAVWQARWNPTWSVWPKATINVMHSPEADIVQAVAADTKRVNGDGPEQAMRAIMEDLERASGGANRTLQRDKVVPWRQPGVQGSTTGPVQAPPGVTPAGATSGLETAEVPEAVKPQNLAIMEEKLTHQVARTATRGATSGLEVYEGRTNPALDGVFMATVLGARAHDLGKVPVFPRTKATAATDVFKAEPRRSSGGKPGRGPPGKIISPRAMVLMQQMIRAQRAGMSLMAGGLPQSGGGGFFK